MAAVRSSKQVVCQTCGDEGFENAFVYCVNCLDFAIHRYCLNVMPKTSDELVKWCCEDCKVRSSKSQEKEAEIVSGKIEAICIEKKQKKRKSIACIIAGSKVVNCQENVEDHGCEYIDIQKWLFPHHVPKKNRSTRKKIAACLAAKSKGDKLPCVLMADSLKHSLDAKKVIAPCEQEKSISDTSCREIELDKTSNHELQDETGSNVSRSAVLENNFQDICNTHTQPLTYPVWRGGFSIHGKDYDKFEGFVAHLSNKACTKVFKEAIMLPSLLNLKLQPKSTLWPKSFDECDPSDDNIALYFFPAPGDPKNDEAFDYLVSDMMGNGLGMRTTSKNGELLIFTSLVLHPHFQRYKNKCYLWGVFRGKRNNPASEQPTIDVKGMLTRMKALDVVSPRSPLSNNGESGVDMDPEFGD